MPAHWAVAALLLLLCAEPAEALAEEAPPSTAEEAAGHFRRGGELYSAGRYQEALAEFQRAHELEPHPANLFNMARCYENLGDAAAALARYREALEGTVGATERADIQRRIDGILERAVRVFVSSEPSGATVLVDAREEPEAGVTPLTLELVPGPHRLILSAEGHMPTARRVDVLVGEQEPVTVTLDPIRQTPCPECDRPEVVELCQRVDLTGLRAHLAVSFPIGIPVSHGETEVQLLAGVGIRAHLTHDQVIVGGRLNIHPYAKDEPGASATRTYSMLFGVLEAGYAWGLEVASLRLTGGVAVLSDLWSERSEDPDGGRNFHASTAFFGWAGAGLDVYALRWLSIGLDAGLALGARPDGDFELFGVVAAVITFHL